MVLHVRISRSTHLFLSALAFAAADNEQLQLEALLSGFVALDKDHSGSIDHSEYEPVKEELESAFEGLSFETLDTNNDGRITFEEVKTKPWLGEGDGSIEKFRQYRLARGSHTPPFDAAHLAYGEALEDPHDLPMRILDARQGDTHLAEVVRQLRVHGVAVIKHVLTAAEAGVMAAALEAKTGRQDGRDFVIQTPEGRRHHRIGFNDTAVGIGGQ